MFLNIPCTLIQDSHYCVMFPTRDLAIIHSHSRIPTPEYLNSPESRLSFHGHLQISSRVQAAGSLLLKVSLQAMLPH